MLTLIEKSFKVCAVTTNIDGSEDENVMAVKKFNCLAKIQNATLAGDQVIEPDDDEEMMFVEDSDGE